MLTVLTITPTASKTAVVFQLSQRSNFAQYTHAILVALMVVFLCIQSCHFYSFYPVLLYEY